MSKLRVLIIDPWGINATGKYLNGLIYGISGECKTMLAANYYFKLTVPSHIAVKRIFFRRSEMMSNGIMRKIIRGIEYIYGYKRLIKYLKTHEKFDVIHINWLLMYKIDRIFLPRLKRLCGKLVYTAHNVLPHTDGEKNIRDLHGIYNVCDRIILHGSNIRDEFCRYFPEFSDKLYIQKHGADVSPDVSYSERDVPEEIREKYKKYKKIFLFNGDIHFNKGVDRLIPVWRSMPSDCLLVIAGRTDPQYAELLNYSKEIMSANNIMFLNEYVEQNTLNFLIANCDLLLLPYRHASMSGVVFTAADFSKPILSTDVGAIPEYIINGENSYIIENDDAALKSKLQFIAKAVSNSDLRSMGNKLHLYIGEACSWPAICMDLIQNCYR